MSIGGLKSGADIDPLTLRPIDETQAAKRFEQEKKEETTLRDQAAFLNVTSSNEGRQLIDLIIEKLEARIGDLIKIDPVANSYASFLNEIGHREVMAKRAVEKLYKRQFE